MAKLARAGSAAWQFAMPRRRSMLHTLHVNTIPAVDGPPLPIYTRIKPEDVMGPMESAGHIQPPANYGIYVTNTHEGVYAFLSLCTHMHCIYTWSAAASCFACPCHGSQFKLNGDYIAGPAPRNLDRFPITVYDANNRILAVSDDKSGLVSVPSDAVTLTVDYGHLILGKSHV